MRCPNCLEEIDGQTRVPLATAAFEVHAATVDGLLGVAERSLEAFAEVDDGYNTYSYSVRRARPYVTGANGVVQFWTADVDATIYRKDQP